MFAKKRQLEELPEAQRQYIENVGKSGRMSEIPARARRLVYAITTVCTFLLMGAFIVSLVFIAQVFAQKSGKQTINPNYYMFVVVSLLLLVVAMLVGNLGQDAIGKIKELYREDHCTYSLNSDCYDHDEQEKQQKTARFLRFYKTYLVLRTILMVLTLLSFIFGFIKLYNS